MAMLPTMLEEDRKRAGWSVCQGAWLLGVSVREYREIEAGARWPNWETFRRICELYGSAVVPVVSHSLRQTEPSTR